MNIFIAGLDYKVTDGQLSSMFEEYGEVMSARVITDRETGRSKGYGFVEMPDDASANRAIAELNETDMGGKTISVSEARPREERSSFGGGGGRSGGGRSGGGRDSYGRGGSGGGSRDGYNRGGGSSRY